MNGHSELVIERVSKEDSGTYTCVAENIVGTIKSLGFVYVKGELKYLTNFILLLFIFLKVNSFVLKFVPERISTVEGTKVKD